MVHTRLHMMHVGGISMTFLHTIFQGITHQFIRIISLPPSCLVFPLCFCAVTWVENSAVIQRAVEMLPVLKLYVDAVAKTPPASRSFTNVKKAVADKMLAAKLGLAVHFWLVE